MCGFLLLIRKSQRLSAQNREVYCDWRDCLSCPRLLRKTGGLRFAPVLPHLPCPASLPGLMPPLVSNCPTAISAVIPAKAKCLVAGILFPISGPARPQRLVLGSSWNSCSRPGSCWQCQAQSKLIRREAVTPAEGQLWLGMDAKLLAGYGRGKSFLGF